MVTIQDANTYFSTVLHNAEWVDADDGTKTRALATAEQNLQRIVKSGFVIPKEAIFEQAIMLLRMDDSFFKAQLGQTQASVSGISISYDLSKVKLVNGIPISQMAIAIIKEAGGSIAGITKVGRYLI
ncbi:hypothetical protein P9695_08780 [Weizmannia sp. CD-2023]|uniref:hypothetical protein n=1 Tax=Heyndrickxia TaxID=2837504 RepID=UPI002E1F3F4F|nr:hypothetical protein [Weizmannia sp. CD-2023]MED4899715.1 hypothetical protein [Weizmannia sp. CD-2023]